MQVVNSLAFLQPQGKNEPVSFKESLEETKVRVDRLNMETKYLLQNYFSADAPLTWGIFEPTAPGALSKLMKLEVQMGQRFKFLLYYHHLFGSVPIDTVVKLSLIHI